MMNKLTEIAYFTENVSAMADFYQNFLGSKPVAQSESMAIFMVGQTKIFIHHKYIPEKGDLPPENHTAYNVEDVDAACQALEAQGLKIEVQPKDYYWGRSAYIRDPDGHFLELIQQEEA